MCHCVKHFQRKGQEITERAALLVGLAEEPGKAHLLVLGDPFKQPGCETGWHRMFVPQIDTLPKDKDGNPLAQEWYAPCEAEPDRGVVENVRAAARKSAAPKVA